jgi:hypothetical protein
VERCRAPRRSASTKRRISCRQSHLAPGPLTAQRVAGRESSVLRVSENGVTIDVQSGTHFVTPRAYPLQVGVTF